MSSTLPIAQTATPAGRLRGKTAIVTGAPRSIGAAVAAALAAEGANVVVHYFNRPEEADHTAVELRSAGGSAITLGGDLSHSGEVKALFEQAAEHFGGVDIVVANAGATSAPSSVAEISDELFERLLNADTRATFNVLRAAARVIRDGGRIINISSSSVRFEPAGFAAYSTSKAGALTTIGILAKELGARGITANSIMAGPIGAGFLDPASEIVKNAADAVDDLAAAAPAGRLGQPDDIAPIALFLASPESGWVNGQTILANNGALV